MNHIPKPTFDSPSTDDIVQRLRSAFLKLVCASSRAGDLERIRTTPFEHSLTRQPVIGDIINVMVPGRDQDGDPCLPADSIKCQVVEVTEIKDAGKFREKWTVRLEPVAEGTPC